MAKHMVKCLYCGEMFDASTEPFIKPNLKRYAHKSCAENNENQKSKEEKDRESLESFIKQLFNIDKITPKIKKQIEDYRKNKNFTYSGIHKTLKYFFEVKGNSIEKANGGIGIVPFVYDEAFNYWRALWETKERNSEIKIQDYILPVKEIHISSPRRKPMKETRKLFTFLEQEQEGG